MFNKARIALVIIISIVSIPGFATNNLWQQKGAAAVRGSHQLATGGSSDSPTRLMLEQEIALVEQKEYKAQRDAKTHERRSEYWAQYAEDEHDLGTWASAREPLAPSNARIQKMQMEESLKKAAEYRDQATRLESELDTL